MSPPPVHSVHFYDHDDSLIARLKSIVANALHAGDSVLIVATEEHRLELARALRLAGVALEALGNRFQRFDARDMLAKFMVHGRPNRARFAASVGKLIGEARKAAVNEHRGLMVFGEMVAVLWRDGNKAGALELERLWNELLHDRTFHLHCAYPRWILNGNPNDLTIKSICDEHSSVLGFAKRLDMRRPAA